MAVISHLTSTDLQAGWFPDPEGVHHLRYFDGVDWTDHVTHFGPTPCQGCHNGQRPATA
jgi:hypothetical protein